MAVIVIMGRDHKTNFPGENTSSSKESFRMPYPAGLGSFAINVSPPLRST